MATIVAMTPDRTTARSIACMQHVENSQVAPANPIAADGTELGDLASEYIQPCPQADRSLMVWLSPVPYCQPGVPGPPAV